MVTVIKTVGRAVDEAQAPLDRLSAVNSTAKSCQAQHLNVARHLLLPISELVWLKF